MTPPCDYADNCHKKARFACVEIIYQETEDENDAGFLRPAIQAVKIHLLCKRHARCFGPKRQFCLTKAKGAKAPRDPKPGSKLFDLAMQLGTLEDEVDRLRQVMMEKDAK